MHTSLGYFLRGTLWLLISAVVATSAMEIGDFSVSVTPNALTVQQGVSSSSRITVGSGVIVLTCADYLVAATSSPPGLDLTLSDNHFCIGTNQQAASTLTINPSGAPPGTYAITVTVGLCTSEPCASFSLTHTTTIAVNIVSTQGPTSAQTKWWSGWSSMGGVLPGNVAVASNADGRLEVFARGTDSSLWHNWQTASVGGWSGWVSLGGALSGDPIVGQNADGRLDVFAPGTDSALWHIYQVAPSDNWSAWEGLGKPPGIGLGSLVLARNQDGRLEIFAIGSDQALWHIYQMKPNNGWGGWSSLGIPPGVSLSSQSVGQNQDGRLEVFAIGADRALWHIYQVAANGNWSGWGGFDSAPALSLSAAAVGRNQDGRLEVFVRATDNRPWHIWQMAPNDGWSGWASLGETLTSNIAVVNNAEGGLEVFARGTHNGILHIAQWVRNNGWSSWESLGGGSTSDPAVGRNADGRLEIFARGNDNGLWHDWQKKVKASDVFFEARVYQHHDPRNIIARDVVIAGWLAEDPWANQCDHPRTPGGCEDFQYAVIPDPDYVLDPNLNPTLSSLQSAVLPGNGGVVIFFGLEGSRGPTKSLTLQDVVPGNPSQKPCWERDPNASDPSLRPCDSRGIAINSFLIPGNFGTYNTNFVFYDCFFTQKNPPGDALTCWERGVQTPSVHVELNAWYHAVDGPKPDPTWVQDSQHPETFWAFDPLYPDKNQNPDLGPLKAGDYVVMRGTLWQDGAHFPKGSGFCRYLGGFFCGSSEVDRDLEQHDCWDRGTLFGHGGWIEMHPPDSIVRINRPRPQLPQKTVAGVTLCAPVEVFDASRYIDVRIRPLDYATGRYLLRPSSSAKLNFSEMIDGRFTDMRNVDEHTVTVVDDLQDPHIAVHVKVHSSGTLSIQAREGRFKAVYTLWWQ